MWCWFCKSPYDLFSILFILLSPNSENIFYGHVWIVDIVLNMNNQIEMAMNTFTVWYLQLTNHYLSNGRCPSIDSIPLYKSIWKYKSLNEPLSGSICELLIVTEFVYTHVLIIWIFWAVIEQLTEPEATSSLDQFENLILLLLVLKFEMLFLHSRNLPG